MHQVSYFSSPGPVRNSLYDKPEVFAPGRYIAAPRSKHLPLNNALSATNSEYIYFSGTSFAAPHVAGTGALLLQKWILDRQSDYDGPQMKIILSRPLKSI